MADKRTSTTREERGMERSSNRDRSSSALASRSANPFSMLDRFAEEMDRVFENFWAALTSVGRRVWPLAGRGHVDA